MRNKIINTYGSKTEDIEKYDSLQLQIQNNEKNFLLSSFFKSKVNSRILV